MTTLAEESDDLVTCAVCLTDYNEKKRRPKFLPCAHTVCLSCLKVISLLQIQNFLMIADSFYYHTGHQKEKWTSNELSTLQKRVQKPS